MDCTPINLTKEQVINAINNRELLWDFSPEDNVNTVFGRYKFLQDNMVLPEGENKKYTLMGSLIEKRISELAKSAYEGRIGSSAVERELQQPDVIKKKDAGIRVHGILAELMEVKSGSKKIQDVKVSASKGDYAVSGEDFDELASLVNEIYSDIKKMQKEIDPKGEVTILIEQRTLDPITNRGGTMDIHAIFSDNTAIIYDYKTTHSRGGENYNFGRLTEDLLHENKIADNELSMAEYKRIAIKRMGVKSIRQTRLIPIHLRLAMLPESQQTEFNYRSKKIDLIEAGLTKEHLRSIPVAGEATKYEGVNEILEKQFNLRNTLNKKLRNEKLSNVERDRIQDKVKTLTKAIRRTIVDGEIFDIIKAANDIIAEINTRIKIPQLNGKNEPNPLYLDNSELKELKEEISIYTDIIDNTSLYYRDLQEADPKEFERLTNELSVIGSNISMALSQVDNEIQKRTLEMVEEDAKNSKGGLKPISELDFFTRNFTRISEIDHPIFRAAWSLIQDKLYDQRKELEKISDDIDTKHKEVATWAKTNGMSVYDALKKIIDFSTGNLINKTTKELHDKIESAYVNPDLDKGAKELKKYLEIKNVKTYKEDFDRRYKEYKEKIKFRYKDQPREQEKKLDSWYNYHNLLESNQAWTNRNNRWQLKIKEDVETANLSPEYKAIMNVKPLMDYYNMYVKYNNEFRNVLGIAKYYKMPYNFIPNIRKTMSESVAMEDVKSSFKYIGHEFWDSFHVREDDVYISDRDASGDLRRTIPILFLNPLKNKKGDIDNSQKSYDLSKNLLLFAKMAYNYQAMSEIEPTILGMRELMAYPTSQHGGTQVLDSMGNRVRGNIKDFATKKGFDTDTYKLFEDLTDMYLYGIKFKTENSIGNSVRLTKTILKIKSYYAKKALSFAIIPGVGAYLAGNTASFFEATKGISYTRDNIRGAAKNRFENFKKYKALSLSYSIYNEDPIEAMAQMKSATRFTKLSTTRNMFLPLRKADELMNDDLLNRMALNWGIDTENKLGQGKDFLVRLNHPSYDTTGIKSIWELTTLDEKTGKVTIEGLTKDNYILFRDAVKKTSSGIIGSLSQEDLSKIDVHLMYNVMFQFKSWMPGVVKERTGKLTYDKTMQALRWGRYRAAFAEYGMTNSEIDGAQKINDFMSQILLPNIGRTVLDLITFGAAFKGGLAGVGKDYTDPKTGKVRKIRTNVTRAKRMYYDWALKNDIDTNKVTFEMFLETKEAQMKAMIVELRTILSFMSVLLFLGADGEDEEPRYMQNWASRFAYKSLGKANSELTFLWSPGQLTQVIKNPVPMASVFTDVLKLFKNTFDEGRDVVFGENSPYDKSGIFFYTLQMGYGGTQMARFLELYKQYEKSPYLITGSAAGQ